MYKSFKQQNHIVRKMWRQPGWLFLAVALLVACSPTAPLYQQPTVTPLPTQVAIEPTPTLLPETAVSATATSSQPAQTVTIVPAENGRSHTAAHCHNTCHYCRHTRAIGHRI